MTTTKARILAIKLMEKEKENKEFFKEIDVDLAIKNVKETRGTQYESEERRSCSEFTG